MKKLIVLLMLLASLTGFTQNVCPPNISHFDFYFETPVTTGQKVGGVTFCEPDVNQVDSINFVDQYGVFELNASGDILVGNSSAVNENGTYQYYLEIHSTDNGIPMLTTIATVTLWATKPNEPPVICAQ